MAVNEYYFWDLREMIWLVKPKPYSLLRVRSKILRRERDMGEKKKRGGIWNCGV